MSETYRLTIAVRKRSDLDHPTTAEEAVSIVEGLLRQGALIDVVSVVPERQDGKNQMRWG